MAQKENEDRPLSKGGPRKEASTANGTSDLDHPSIPDPFNDPAPAVRGGVSDWDPFASPAPMNGQTPGHAKVTRLPVKPASASQPVTVSSTAPQVAVEPSPLECVRIGCDDPQAPHGGGYCTSHLGDKDRGRYIPDLEYQELVRLLERDPHATPDNILALANKLNSVINTQVALAKKLDKVRPTTPEDKILAEMERRDVQREAERRILERDGGGREPLANFMVGAQAMDSLPDPTPLISQVLYRESYAILSGRDGSMKTFIALDWALSLAMGKDWMGHKVRPLSDRPRVLFMVGEGASGFKKRKRAWEKAHGVTVPDDRFTGLFHRVNFYRDPVGVEELVQAVQEGGYGFVVIDHLRLISGGADGNGSDMGVVVDNIKRLVDATGGGSVLLIAHTDKNDRDTRGFSGIEDDSDTVWRVVRQENEDHVKLKNTKMKDEEEHPEMTLAPDVVELGTHAETGERVTSLVLRAVDPFEVETAQDAKPKAESSPVKKVKAVFLEMFSAIGATQSDLVEAMGVHKSTVSRGVNPLVESGWLEQKGSRYFMSEAAKAEKPEA